MIIEILVGILVLALVAAGIYNLVTGNNPTATAGPDDPILEMIGEADAAAPVTSASWRDRNGNRGRYRRAHQWQPPAPQPAPQVVLAGGGGGWWPVIGGGGTPPAAAGLTITVDEVTPAPAGGGPATYSIRVTGGNGPVTFGMTGLPGGFTWGIAPNPFNAPRGGTLVVGVPAGAARGARPTLFARIGTESASADFTIN